MAARMVYKTKLTSYEIYAMAVTAMIIDHVGYFFFDQDLWLRTLRLAAVIWFFPLGYNPGRKATRGLWIGLVILCIPLLYLGALFPLPVLATMILIRYTLSPFMEFTTRNKWLFWAGQAALIALIPVTHSIVEYGTAGLLVAMAGWVLRDSEAPQTEAMRAGLRYVPTVRCYFSFVALVYLCFEEMIFKFSLPQLAFAAAGVAWALVLMTQLRQMILNSLKSRPKDIISRTCQMIGHKTLEIYVIHLLIFYMFFIF